MDVGDVAIHGHVGIAAGELCALCRFSGRRICVAAEKKKLESGLVKLREKLEHSARPPGARLWPRGRERRDARDPGDAPAARDVGAGGRSGQRLAAPARLRADLALRAALGGDRRTVAPDRRAARPDPTAVGRPPGRAGGGAGAASALGGAVRPGRHADGRRERGEGRDCDDAAGRAVLRRGRRALAAAPGGVPARAGRGHAAGHLPERAAPARAGQGVRRVRDLGGAGL